MPLEIDFIKPDFETVANQNVWPLTLSVRGPDISTGLPAEVFVVDVLPDGDQVEEVFACVADVADLSNIDTVPDTDGDPINPSYRTDSIRLDFLSPTQRDTYFERILQDIGDLVANWEASLDTDTDGVLTVTGAFGNLTLEEML